MAEEMKAQITSILGDEDKLFELAQSAFDETDTDKSGYLDKGEITVVFHQIAKDFSLGELSQDQIDHAWGKIESNGDGKISVHEFKPFVKMVLEKALEDA